MRVDRESLNTLRILYDIAVFTGSERSTLEPTSLSADRVGELISALGIILLDALAEAVRKGAIKCPDRDTIREMTTFVIWEDGKPAGEEGCHDDRVIAFALAFLAQREHRHISNAPPRAWEAKPTATGL